MGYREDHRDNSARHAGEVDLLKRQEIWNLKIREKGGMKGTRQFVVKEWVTKWILSRV